MEIKKFEKKITYNSILYILLGTIHNKIIMDPHSFANFDDAVATHYHLKLAADFKSKVMRGNVDIRVRVLQDDCETFLMDCKDLAIETVHLAVTGQALDWTIPHINQLGQCLCVYIPVDYRKRNAEFTVRIFYSTTPKPAGIQWLDANQTAGKRHPFCYTQCEAILARTVVPCQDTPAVKTPYSIEIKCPRELVAVCSGLKSDDPYIEEATGMMVYQYKQTVPIPAYLIAFAIGDLRSAKIGPRSRVYAEPELIEKAVHEFSEETEKYIQAGESITGVEYSWGQYDILVLPSAFPYGGMENPNLTFLSASLLAGDRSLTNVVAHEITHSWAGNFTTNSSWSDFWLNEGFTVYIERLILERVMGSEAYRHLEMLIGYYDLKKTVASFADAPEYTKLVPNLRGVNPDDVFSKIPYEKGSLFLFYLETIVGKTNMMSWLNHYFRDFQFKSISTRDMTRHFCDYFADKNVDLAKIDWGTWLYAPGMPDFDPVPHLDLSLSENCKKLAERWMTDNGSGACDTDLTGFRSKQIMYFLDLLIQSDKINHEALALMNDKYKFSQSGNAEICFRWIQLCLKNGYREVIPQADGFLSRHGRGLYVKTLYKMLADIDHYTASQIYLKNSGYYHSVICNYLNPLLLPGKKYF